MGVTKHRDSKTGVWVIRWGGRKNRGYLYTGKRDGMAAEVIRKSKELELAILEAAQVEERVAVSVVAKLDAVISTKIEEQIRAVSPSSSDQSADPRKKLTTE